MMQKQQREDSVSHNFRNSQKVARIIRFSMNSSNRDNLRLGEGENKSENMNDELVLAKEVPENKSSDGADKSPRPLKKNKKQNLTMEMTLLTHSQVTSNATANFKDKPQSCSSLESLQDPLPDVMPLGVAR